MELSGPHWCSRYPTSSDVAALAEPFQSNVRSFLAALTNGGATISVTATRRPPERAYLMHWAWQIANGLVGAAHVPPMAGVAIGWVHSTNADSVQAAQGMVDAYGLVYDASLTSHHITGNAIDMTISWNGALTIRKADGSAATISSSPRSGSNRGLWPVGGTYAVFKLASDPPHWSFDGH